MIHIRPATIHDIPTVEKIYFELFSLISDWQPEYYIKAMQDKNFISTMLQSEQATILVAANTQEVLGFIIVQEQETPPYTCVIPKKLAYIIDLAVTETSRGLGIGKALMSSAEAWAKNRGLDYIELSVLHENTGAKALYEKLGFNDVIHTMRKPI